MQIKEELEEKGYIVIKNILDHQKIEKSKELFFNWKNNLENFEEIYKQHTIHGIFKYHEVGHQEHAWYLRTLPEIQDIYKTIWNTNELVVSFDGCCYIPKEFSKKDNIWTHTDQAPNKKGLTCYQSFISLTNNKERTLLVYEGSHKLHEAYFNERNIKDSKNWHLIEESFLNSISNTKKILEIPAGSLVLWDSRVFHQNQYGKPNSEERLVQYICFLPKNVKENSQSQQKKRLLYLENLRTTSHWPYPIHVNPLQGRTYGDINKIIDYKNLKKPNLDKYYSEILKII